jgi:type II secretory pathway component PulJ
MKNAAGESLIEALAAILIFTFGSILMLTLFSGAKRLNEAARARMQEQSEVQLTRELGQALTPGTVTVSLGDREVTLDVVFSGEGEAVFFPGEDGR